MNPPPFRAPWYLRHPHLQTVVGQYLPRRRLPLPTTQRFVDFPNGDRAALHDSQPPEWTPTTPATVLIHGMGGSHQSGYLVRFAEKLYHRGHRVFRVDLRGYGASLPTCRQPANGGASGDLLIILKQIAAWVPGTPLWLVGYSLGGNITLRCLGAHATELPTELVKAVSVNAPIDMDRCCRLLEERRNRIYERYFIKDLWQQACLRQQSFPHLTAPDRAKLDRLRRFDDLYTAPLAGFKNAGEYYAYASSLRFISQIEVPTLLLTARDDPFIDPLPYEQVAAKPHVQVEITPGGGHLGYLAPDGSGSLRWLDQRLLSYLRS